MRRSKWHVIVETLEKWSREIVYYWETTLPFDCKYGLEGKVISSKQYKSKRMAVISWKRFAEENKISSYSIYDAHKAVSLQK